MSDPVLDAYVKRYGPRPVAGGLYPNADNPVLYGRQSAWDRNLAIWQEATLIEREAAEERVVTLYENEEHEAPFLVDICNAIRGTKP